MDLSDNAAHILIVDDDQGIRDHLARYLLENGFRVTTANDAACARASMRGLAFDLVILDVMMPGESGLDLGRDLKTISNIPICMLTTRAEPEHRIEGLEIGVDDFVPKPLEPRELLLRLQNILKRGRGPSGPREEIKMGDSIFYVGRGELKRGDESVKLTERERDLLRLFAQRRVCPSPATSLPATTPRAASAQSTCRSTDCATRSRSTPPIPSIFRPCAEKATFCTQIDTPHSWHRDRGRSTCAVAAAVLRFA
jgi:two-component system, OmpR family, phosphate regulon response regulator OmpR